MLWHIKTLIWFSPTFIAYVALRSYFVALRSKTVALRSIFGLRSAYYYSVSLETVVVGRSP